MCPPKKTHCKWGHEFVPENIMYYTDKKGYVLRKCKECRRIQDRERYYDKPAYRERQKYLSRCRYHGVEPCHAAPL